MLKNPEINDALEILKAAKDQLVGYQKECDAALALRSSLTTENKRLDKERVYLEGLLNDLEKSVKEREEKLLSLNQEISIASADLRSIRLSISEEKESLSKEREYMAEERIIFQKEKENAKSESSLLEKRGEELARLEKEVGEKLDKIKRFQESI